MKHYMNSNISMEVINMKTCKYRLKWALLALDLTPAFINNMDLNRREVKVREFDLCWQMSDIDGLQAGSWWSWSKACVQGWVLMEAKITVFFLAVILFGKYTLF